MLFLRLWVIDPNVSLSSFYVHNQPKVNHLLVDHSGVSISVYDPLFLLHNCCDTLRWTLVFII